LFFLICINDLLNITAGPLKPVLFADDTSIIITNPSPSKLKEDTKNIMDWLSLNFDKTYFLQLRPKNSQEIKFIN